MFPKFGLDATVQTLNYGSAIAAAVAGGAADIGQANIMSLAAAFERGLPVSLIAPGGLYDTNKPTSLMIVRKDSPLKTAKDLSGKLVAVNGLKSVTQVSVQAWADANGGDSDAIKFMEMPFVEMEGALASGRIDAALMADPDATAALSLGHTRPFAKAFDAIGKNWLIGGWFANTQWINANPDVVRKFAATMRAASQWANSNQAQSAVILEKNTKVHVGTANRIIYALRLDPAQVQPQIDVAAKYHLLKASFPAKALISTVGG